MNEYLKTLPADRREALTAVRKVILKNLPKGYEESMMYGMIGYGVPLKLFPEGYLGDGKTPLPYAALASQKNHMAVYLMCAYGNKEIDAWFRKAYQATGKKLDMGKSCVRFKKLDDLALNVIGEVITKVPVNKFIEIYKESREGRK